MPPPLPAPFTVTSDRRGGSGGADIVRTVESNNEIIYGLSGQNFLPGYDGQSEGQLRLFIS